MRTTSPFDIQRQERERHWRDLAASPDFIDNMLAIVLPDVHTAVHEAALHGGGHTSESILHIALTKLRDEGLLT